jgi:hypothetical protein
MASSTFSREARRATALTLVAVLFVSGGWPLAGLLLDAFKGLHRFPQPHLAFLVPSPGFAFYQVARSGSTGAPAEYYGWSMLSLQALGWLALAGACFALPRCWQDRLATPWAARWRQSWTRLKYGTAEEAKARRDRLLEINPVLWVGGRDRLKGWLVWAFLLSVGMCWLWGYLEDRRHWLEPIVGIWTALVAHAVLKTWLATEACRLMLEHRQGGALELLLCTSLSTGQIVRGQHLALWRQFGGPVVVVLVADMFLLLGSMSGRFVASGDEMEVFVTYFAGMLMLALDSYVLGWVGTWYGLSARTFNRAAAGAIGGVLVLPWVLFIVTSVLYFTFGWQRSLDLGFAGGVGVWFLLNVGLNLVFLWHARRRLHQRFRLVAAQQYAPRGRRWWRPRRVPAADPASPRSLAG